MLPKKPESVRCTDDESDSLTYSGTGKVCFQINAKDCEIKTMSDHMDKKDMPSQNSKDDVSVIFTSLSTFLEKRIDETQSGHTQVEHVDPVRNIREEEEIDSIIEHTSYKATIRVIDQQVLDEDDTNMEICDIFSSLEHSTELSSAVTSQVSATPNIVIHLCIIVIHLNIVIHLCAILNIVIHLCAILKYSDSFVRNI